MSRVHVIDGQLSFDASLIFEMIALTHGPEEARTIRRAEAEQVQDERVRRAILETADSPVFVPLTRADKYAQAYRFCQEIGEGFCVFLANGEESLDNLCDAFVWGFASAAEIETPGIEMPQYEGIAVLCFQCGELVCNMIWSIFTEVDETDFQPPEPDFFEILRHFWTGLMVRE
jgi:hypothetical protein